MNNDKIIEKINKNNIFDVVQINENSKTVILQCKTCGSIEVKKINQAMDSRCHCKACYLERKRKHTEQKIIDKLKDMNYDLIDKYIDKNTKIRFQCKSCKTIFYASPKSLIENETTCPNKKCCYNKNSVYKNNNGFSQKEVETKIKENSSYILLSKYENVETPILVKCSKCGQTFYTTYGAIMYRHVQCPTCKNNNKRKNSFDYAQNELDKLEPHRFIIQKNSFINLRKTSIIYDTKLNENLELSLAYLLNKIRHPKYKNTKIKYHNEEIIKKYLMNQNIEFIQQKTFNDLKNINNLYFDFYIPSLNLCIEYDGEYHYLDIFGKNILSKQKHNDNIKNKYCKKNNINLLRIPYWNRNNIVKILNDLFNNANNENISKKINNLNIKYNLKRSTTISKESRPKRVEMENS